MIVPGQLPPHRAEVDCPTLWGLTPRQLHDRFWAWQGIQVVRRGQVARLSSSARAFLLAEPQTLSILDPRSALRLMKTGDADLVYLRIQDFRDGQMREHVETDDAGRFIRFVRSYDRPNWRLVRMAFTASRAVALRWQAAADPCAAWKTLRKTIVRVRRAAASCEGMFFDADDPAELAAFVRALTDHWQNPGSAIGEVHESSEGVWGAPDAAIDPAASLVGPVWVGAGRIAGPETILIGPTILWDSPAARPDPGPVRWPEDSQSPAPTTLGAAAPAHRLSRAKRIFDLLFSLAALAVTLPFYLPIALLILIDDGWPIFFIHHRETVGGREFPCIKFRTMRKNAEQLQTSLQTQNLCDGPQFHIKDDPRLTRVGRYLRRWRIDELPQFLNVLAGQMSVVGPRPSPYRENQFCPPWREARLSVRPGITGLWQVRRSRRRGSDFQEWIKYDIEYVEHSTWRTDLAIILQTIFSLLGGGDASR